MDGIMRFVRSSYVFKWEVLFLNLFRAGVPFRLWEKTTRIQSRMSLKRDCSAITVITLLYGLKYVGKHTQGKESRMYSA